MSRLLWAPASRPSQAWLVEGLLVEALGKSRPSGMLSTSTALGGEVGREGGRISHGGLDCECSLVCPRRMEDYMYSCVSVLVILCVSAFVSPDLWKVVDVCVCVCVCLSMDVDRRCHVCLCMPVCSQRHRR